MGTRAQTHARIHSLLQPDMREVLAVRDSILNGGSDLRAPIRIHVSALIHGSVPCRWSS